MFQEVRDPLGSKSLTLDKGPTLLESIFRQVGLNPQLPPSQDFSYKPLFQMPLPPPTTHSARARPIQYSIPLRGQPQRVDCSTDDRLWG